MASTGQLGAFTDEGLPVFHGKLEEFPRDPVACMRRLYQQFGSTVALQEGHNRIVFGFGPENNRRILSDTHAFHSRFFLVRGPRHSAQRRLTCGLLSMNEDEHRRHRRLLMGTFSKKAILDYHETLTALTQQMLDSWTLGEVRDMHRDMTTFMLRVTSTILFGFDQFELAYEIGEKIDRWVEMNHLSGVGAFISSDDSKAGYEQLLACAEDLEAQVRQMIELRRSDRTPSSDVLSLLIRSHDELGGLSDDDLVGHAALLFGAAHLTTAHSLTWTLVLLAQHPEILRELQAEIDGQLAGRVPVLADHEHMPVTERVIKESMRVLPASSYSQRITNEPVSLGPFDLPRGTPIIFSQFITHHMPDLFPEPERFLPDRWRTITPSPYAYLPFGTGPRMCLGGPMAMMILRNTIPSILQRYKPIAVPDSEISGKVISTMLTPTTSVPMQLLRPQEPAQIGPLRGNIHQMVDLPDHQERRVY